MTVVSHSVHIVYQFLKLSGSYFWVIWDISFLPQKHGIFLMASWVSSFSLRLWQMPRSGPPVQVPPVNWPHACLPDSSTWHLIYMVSIIGLCNERSLAPIAHIPNYLKYWTELCSFSFKKLPSLLTKPAPGCEQKAISFFLIPVLFKFGSIKYCSPFSLDEESWGRVPNFSGYSKILMNSGFLFIRY